MTFMDVEPTTFLIRKERLDLGAVFVVLHGRVQIIQISDELDRFLELQFPERQDADRAILCGGHPRRCDGEALTARWPQITDVELNPVGAHPNGRCGATEVVPVGFAEVGLYIDAIQLAIPQEGELGILGYDGLHLREQRTLGGFRKMALGALTTTQQDRNQRRAASRPAVKRPAGLVNANVVACSSQANHSGVSTVIGLPSRIYTVDR